MADPPGRSPSEPEVTAYQQLVRDARERQGLSYSDVARRSGRREDGRPRLSRQNLWRIESKPPTNPPDEDTIRGLSSGLGLGEETIRNAISESLNLRVLRPRDQQMQRLIDRANDLPDENRERWLRLARALVEALAAEVDRPTDEQSSPDAATPIMSRSVTTDQVTAENDEPIVQADVGQLAEQTAEEREYVDMISDAALNRLRRRLLGE